MSRLPHAGNYRDLIVYLKARQLSKDVFELSKKFPKEETYSLTDQIRRSSRSIGAQVAESWGKRRYEKHFISKLSDGVSEQYETEHWLLSAYDCHYISKGELEKIMNQCAEIGRMLNGMIDKSHKFCQQSSNQLREESPQYFTNSQ